ncbi:MAG: FAD-binding oxidoreductase [Candidatus Hydrogenedentes bacterium]|nr:FAD-binding oxidoreductase [Candidatus Hydrogenedentota bacterium]
MTPLQTGAALCDYFQAVLPEGACDDSPGRCAGYARTTLPGEVRPACVLYPASTAEVERVVAVANAHQIPLYPLSRGKNWGYGDACAPAEGMAIVDLSRMNRILELNTEYGYVRIEPGVSQGELHDYIAQHAPGYWLDCTGAGPDASIAGNTLERGFGHTAYADHLRTSCNFEVVLGTGVRISTGFGHFGNAVAANLFPYGLGPSLDGVFTQSNFGIVTALTVWLLPRPQAFRSFYIKVKEERHLAEIVERLRPLRMQGILNSAVHIGNDIRVFTSQQQYPWMEAAGKTPLPLALRRQLRDASRLGAWNITGSIMGSRAQVRAAARELKAAMRAVGFTLFVTDARLDWGDALARAISWLPVGRALARNLEALRPNYGLLKGIPTTFPLKSLQWRLREPGGSLDPLETRCGLMWVAPVLPLSGAHAEAVLRLVEPIFTRHGFDLPVTFTLLNDRSMVAVMNISFDKRVEEEGAAAAQCYEEAQQALRAAGYYPYRAGIQAMPSLWENSAPYAGVLTSLKQAFDPNGIIAPGRYVPSATDAD